MEANTSQSRKNPFGVKSVWAWARFVLVLLAIIAALDVGWMLGMSQPQASSKKTRRVFANSARKVSRGHRADTVVAENSASSHASPAIGAPLTQLPFPVYYLNLDRSVSRRHRMEATFNPTWNLTRVAGLDGGGGLSNLKPLLAGDAEAALKEMEKHIPYKDRSTHLKEIGVTLGHLKALDKVAKGDAAMALIVEDDITAELVAHWTQPLPQLLSGLPADWGVFKLAYSYGPFLEFIKAWQGKISQGNAYAFGTVAYMIRRDVARDFLARSFFEHDGAGVPRLNLKRLPSFPCVVRRERPAPATPRARTHEIGEAPGVTALPFPIFPHPVVSLSLCPGQLLTPSEDGMLG